MPVDVARALEELLESLGANDQFGDEADGRPHRITAAHPIPHGEAMVRGDAELVHCLGVGRYRDEMTAGGLLTERTHDPSSRSIRVGLRFLRDKSLGAYDH